jgi:hypothetical protein
MSATCDYFRAYYADLQRAEDDPMATPRTLHEICVDALRATCGHCWSEPGQPCVTVDPDGFHVARFDRAERHGLISGPDFKAVCEHAVVFTNSEAVAA